MKQLRTSAQNLRELFDKNISVRYIAEPIASFDISTSSADVQEFMEQHDFDVVGIRQDVQVTGYVQKQGLARSRVQDKIILFTASDNNIVDETVPLLDALKILQKSPRRYSEVQ